MNDCNEKGIVAGAILVIELLHIFWITLKELVFITRHYLFEMVQAKSLELLL